MYPTWLNELADEYENQHVSDNRMVRIGAAYLDEPEDIMSAAVLAYVRENKFFPKAADLHPYVIAARENARGRVPYNQLRQQIHYADADILRWEQARGTMPPDDQLDYLWDPGNPHIMVVYMLLCWRRALKPMFAREQKETS